MSFYQTLQQATASEREHLFNAPIIEACRRGDISRRQGRCRDLIKQWLKKMVIGTIDEEYIRIRVL